MRRVVTKDEIDRVPDGGELRLAPGDVVTDHAAEIAARRGVRIVAAEADAAQVAPAVEPRPLRLVVTAEGPDRPALFLELTAAAIALPARLLDAHYAASAGRAHAVLRIEAAPDPGAESRIRASLAALGGGAWRIETAEEGAGAPGRA